MPQFELSLDLFQLMWYWPGIPKELHAVACGCMRCWRGCRSNGAGRRHGRVACGFNQKAPNDLEPPALLWFALVCIKKTKAKPHTLKVAVLL